MERKKFLITCDKQTYDSLREGIARIAGAETRTSDVRGLGGEVVELVIAGTIAAKAAAALLEMIAAAIKVGNTIRSLRLDDKVLTNPDEQALEKLKQEVSS